MKKVQKLTLGAGMQYAQKEVKDLAEKALAKGIYAYEENKTLIGLTLIGNGLNSFVDSPVLDSAMDIINAVAVAKVAYDFTTVEVVDAQEPAPASDSTTATK